jgi:hypothetical protein
MRRRTSISKTSSSSYLLDYVPWDFERVGLDNHTLYLDKYGFFVFASLNSSGASLERLYLSSRSLYFELCSNSCESSSSSNRKISRIRLSEHLSLSEQLQLHRYLTLLVKINPSLLEQLRALYLQRLINHKSNLDKSFLFKKEKQRSLLNYLIPKIIVT